MPSSTPVFNGHTQISPTESHTPFLPSMWPSSRRTPSFSSSISSIRSSSSFPDDSPLFKPSTPQNFSGIPFSWEKLPGVPKNQLSKNKDPSTNLLPLPPSGTPPTPSKKLNNLQETSPLIRNKRYTSSSTSESFKSDPFFAALIECSKEDHGHHRDSIGSLWKESRVTRNTSSDRFGFITTYASCKRTCSVSESIVHLPRTRTYDRFNGKS